MRHVLGGDGYGGGAREERSLRDQGLGPGDVPRSAGEQRSAPGGRVPGRQKRKAGEPETRFADEKTSGKNCDSMFV